ncbi:NUDIX hydrolase [Psychrobacter lutiphocae]|uniref:NUDIX hydrolase n=1 Tax=Psychrobacter lutiphocae TaxID=540500 RepID=UPI0003671C55|nr:membrane protein [Psychrobacter lutiphocae]
MSLSFSHAHSQGSGTTEVVAVLIAITANKARVLTVAEGKLLPNGPLMPLHRSLQAGVRQWVEEQTQQPLGYIEQLYTFVDTNRRNKEGHALVYVSYMGLVQESHAESSLSEANSTQSRTALWRDWYDYFPWEDYSDKVAKQYSMQIGEQLKQWAYAAVNKTEVKKRLQRIYLCWGGDWEQDIAFRDMVLNEGNHRQSTNEMFTKWVAEHALLRYEMLYEAGLIPESPFYNATKLPEHWQQVIGEPMYYDHRRVIATAISRLRAKIEYRPLIFGLMPEEFTLLQLQQSVEALSGVPLHKQNFRRLLESQNLLEPTGNSRQTGRGRPAKLYRFRFDIELQSLLMDSKLPKSNRA